jgi:hypothetical protein
MILNHIIFGLGVIPSIIGYYYIINQRLINRIINRRIK